MCVVQDAKNDLRRLQNHCQYRLSTSFELPAKTITSMACVNAFLSHVVLLAGSDRSLVVADVAVGA